MYSLVILVGYTLDLIFGDPQWSWHPVRLIGELIKELERRLNIEKLNKRLAGVILVILVVGVTISCVWGILKLARFVNPVLYYIISILFIYFALSIKDLGIEVNKVYKSLEKRDINEAKKRLSRIVGRDTAKLDETEIIRATVETVAESTMDGIIAPLFYAFLGGPVLAWAYKAINTLDSMVGYRSDRFIDFGRASAKLDRLVNFIPAGITGILISFSAWCYRKEWLSSMKLALRYFLKGPNNNSETAEAAMAGALGVQLGGLNFYSGVAIKKPFLGQAKKSLEISDINDSIHITYLVSVFGLLIFLAIFLFACPQAFCRETRVVSLAPSITEILFAIGLNEKEVVGVTDYCDYPKEATKILKVGSLNTVSIEKIISLEPDYVFSIGNENSPLNTSLKKVGVNVIVFNPQHINEIFLSILRIGKVVDREKEAKEVVERMTQRLKEIKNKMKKIQNKKKVYVEIWDDPITSCGRDSLVDEVINYSGGINITGKIPILYPTVSQEFIIKENPDVIILGYMSRDQKETMNAVLNRFGWQDINAIKTKNVVCDIEPSIFLRPGPRIVDGIEQIHNRIYGNK